MNLTKPQKLIYDMEKFAGGAISIICGSIVCKGNKSISDLQNAVNKIFYVNDALRIRIKENDGNPYQTITVYQEQNFDVLNFITEQELNSYAENYAKEPIDLYGSLCDAKIIILPDSYGIIIKMHHLIGDAWTLALLGNQFNELLNGNDIESYSYKEYVTNEDKYLNSKRFEKDKSFFLEQFKKCDEATYISEKQADTFCAKRKTFIINKENTKNIVDYANKNNSSVFTLFMTALGIYFNRTHMNSEKFYIGTAVLNRTGFKEKNTAGMFINTVPVLIDLENEKSFLANVENVQNSVLSTFRHQKYNYGDVLADIRKEYNFTEKLYDVMISYQNAKITGITESFESKWHHSGCQAESLQIHIDDRDSEGIFKIHYDYQTEKFTEKEIENLHSHIINLLFDGIQNDDKLIYSLNILNDSEEKQLLFDFNDTAVDYPRDKCVHQLFEEQVEKTPNKTAVIACDKTLTYKELNKEVNRIAHSLIELGIGVGDIVAFALPRKSYLISTMLGILKSGAAYLPIDPDYPQDRIEYMLSDSNAKLFITESNIEKLLNNQNTANLDITMSSEDLCYCIYTSGSTGNPKGTLLKHQGIVNLVTNLKIYNNLSNCDRFGFMTTITFDVATQEIFTALLNGFTGVFMSERKETRADEIIDGIVADKVDVMYATPTYFESLTDTEEKTDKLFNTIKVVCLAGEKFYLNRNALKYKERTNVIFENQYGPVELHVIATATTLRDNDFDSIGKPVGNDKAYIVDQYMQPTPIGVIGELCIAGDGVGAGYLNRPELTAEKFINNPFGKGKMYKTGDLAYWQDDGNIAYVGRNDFQVKIRGLRIELGEIENAISSIDGISQAVVVVRKNNDGRQLICAFYMGNEINAKDIRKHIGKKLPKYMLPHIFTHLNEIPLTSSGKVNRKALPEVDLENISNDTEYVAPTTEKQKIICSCIERLLNVSNIGIKDNFIDLGGDSLKAIELVSKLSSDGYSVSVKDILNSNNIKELANSLIIEDDSVFDEKYTGDVLATPAQMRVYTAQSMNENSTMYNVPYTFKVENIDVNKLQSAIDKMLFRHDILKTQFENIDGNIVQIVNKKAECKVEILNSGNIVDFIRPFNLSKAPLIRVGVYKNTVMIDMHHIITDGSSMPIFFSELNELFVGNELNDKAVQYKEFAVKKFDYSKSEEYWLSVYSDEVPVLEINTDYPRGQKQSFNGNSIYNQIDIDLHNKIKSKCKELGITPYVYYMSGFNILLSKFSSNEDIVVGMPVSGRKAEYLNTIGMFVNTVALRNKPEGTKTIEDFLNEVKNNSLNAIENQDYPFGELVKKLNIEAIGRNPLFDVMFAYQSESMTDIIFNNTKAEFLPIPITTSKYDFTFNIMPRDTDVVLMAEYCTDLYKEHTIKRFIDGYKLILTQMLDINKSIKELSAITENEQQQILFDFNNTSVDYPKDKCVHQLFEEQVQKTPDKTAVIACDKTLTYKELNEKANRIAHSLFNKGIGIGDIIAFMLPRRSYLIATMLGILKAGAAYLPIDPDYPQDRIKYMLEDSKAKFCINEDNIENLLKNGNTENPYVDITSENLCYCIYTSGSTGKPKGTLLTHGNIANYVQNNNNNVVSNIIKESYRRIVSVTTVGFDIFVTESLLPLANGLEILLANEEQAKLQSKLNVLLSKNLVDVMQTTPTKMKSLISDDTQLDYLKNLKVIILGGEALDNQLVQMIHKITNAKIFNIYGPTEATVWVTNAEIFGDDITIGKPIANTQIYIVDKYMQPTPIGVTGELCIAGDCVGAGYLNRPKLTAEKFIDNPFGKGKLYKTGDLAYWREDGNITYVGRNDFQVKIRGLRIELGEIENAISSIDGISQAVVVVRKNTDGRQLICAFYVGQEYDAKDIRNIIGKKLPKYMLPHIFTHIEAMPLTSSGKVNRKALPDVNLENIANDTEYVAPVTNQQKLLCKIVEKVLGVNQVGLVDDFFDLGGDSLKAIEFVSKAHNEGIYFNLQNVFDYPTVNLLCEFLANNDIVHNQYNLNDFEDIHSLLKNNFKCDFVPEKNVVGDILLTGATGFLGIHILAQFIENEAGKIYCIIRGKSNEDSLSRLEEQLKYYFEDKYLELLNKRIIVLCGDIQKANFGINNIPKVDMVINAAASVKHYGSYKYFYDINVGGTINALKVAITFNAKFIQISTLSVSGNSMADIFDAYLSESNKTFSERNLYIEQPLDNVYIRSKFEAEVAVYNEILNGLKANIIRVGNLTNRSSDLKFQPNYQSNAFLSRVKAVIDMGMIPDYLLDLYSEFSPVDDTADAIIKIAQHFDNKNIVFHVNNHNNLYFDRFIELANKIGIPMQVLDGDEFSKNLSTLGSNSKTQYIYEALINDMDKDGKLVYDSNIHIENDLTVEYLKKIGFDWSKIDYDYLKAYVEYFNRLGYLEV